MSEIIPYDNVSEKRLTSLSDLAASLRAGAHREILPSGTISSVYALSAAATTSYRDGPEELRQRIDAMNTPDYIVENFFTEGEKVNGSTVHEIIKTRDGIVSIMQPTSPYAEIDVLVAAAPDDLEATGLPRHNSEKRPLSWYELPLETQRTYNAAQLELLQAMHFATADQPDKKAVIMQNCADQLAPVTSQSIGVPHAHATIHNLANFAPYESNVPGMKGEEAVAHDGELAAEVLPGIRSSITRDLAEEGIAHDGLVVAQRHAAPYGFSLVFTGETAITANNLTEDDSLRKISVAMATVHEQYERLLYANATSQLTHRYGMPAPERIIRQPSYQQLLDITDDGLFRLTYVPILQSRGGPVEKCGVMLDRRADPALLDGDQEALNELYREYASSVGSAALLATDVRLAYI